MTAPPLFDTHAHLHFPELVADLDGVLERARAAGVTGMVTIGTDRETNPAAVGLAEVGRAFSRTLSPPDVQVAVFRRQLAMARDLGKPVVIHCRDAHAEALAILAEERVAEVGGIMHCFSADVAVARRCLDQGLFISLAGPVTYKNARALPEVARFVPADRLVLETDCPFLPPHPHRGERNEPAWVAITAAHVAALRGVSLETLGPIVTANARRLFRLRDR